MHSYNMAAAMLHENCGVIALISEHQTTLSLTRYKSADAMTQQFTCSIATIMLWLCIEWLLRWWIGMHNGIESYGFESFSIQIQKSKFFGIFRFEINLD